MSPSICSAIPTAPPWRRSTHWPPSATGLVEQLLDRMAPDSHELIFFDVNRLAETQVFITLSQEWLPRKLLESDNLSYDFSLVTNASDESTSLVELRIGPLQARTESRDLPLRWPKNVFSLSHVALPFPEDNPVYGITGQSEDTVQFGDLELRGERGLLLVPVSQLTRLRYNPFFSYMTERIAEFLDLGPGVVPTSARGPHPRRKTGLRLPKAG